MRDVYAPWEFIKNAVEARLPFLIERFAEKFMADYFGLKPVKIVEPEIDVALVRFKVIRVWMYGMLMICRDAPPGGITNKSEIFITLKEIFRAVI